MVWTKHKPTKHETFNLGANCLHVIDTDTACVYTVHFTKFYLNIPVAAIVID